MTNDNWPVCDDEFDPEMIKEAIEEKIAKRGCPYQLALLRLENENARWRVDELSGSYGRPALVAAAQAGARAALYHRRELERVARVKRLRKALEAIIDACGRIQMDASVGKLPDWARTEAKAARKMLEAHPEPARRPRGSPGRVAQQRAAEAAAQVWSRAASRRIPRSGKTPDHHPLQMLLRDIGADLFGSANAMSVKLLKAPKGTPNI